MIYENAYVLRADSTEESIKKTTEMVKSTIKDFKGEVLLEDAWGVKSFAQPTSKGETKGHYFYVIYEANGECNSELERRFKISEDVLKFIFVKLGKVSEKEQVLKAYKNPDQATNDAGVDDEKERKMFSKRRSCWFSAKKTTPDWKNTGSYSWLVNEFGKISPGRVTGLRPKYQRAATTAIKRGRCMGLISHMSNRVAR